MNSIDTNILLYAVNKDCPEHKASMDLIQRALNEPQSWVIADQVWFELYRLLRNPSVLDSPLRPEEASNTIEWYRQKSGWFTCAWEPDMMRDLLPRLKNPDFPAQNTFDLVLGITLAAHGVEVLYTRNTRDFEALKLFELRNPVDS